MQSMSYNIHACLASNLAEVRQKLAEADEEDVRRGGTPHQVPASVFIRTGWKLKINCKSVFCALCLACSLLVLQTTALILYQEVGEI